MTHKTAHSASDGSAVLRVESVPFSAIPAQTKLFLDYQSDPRALKHFYPAASDNHTKITDRIPDVLRSYAIDRTTLCDALADDNKSYSVSSKTLENIELLRDGEAVAVVSGQQAGLFLGPLYTIYKALSAIKLAECLRGRGIKAVPVFWVASEDHDFDEVSRIFVLNAQHQLTQTATTPANSKMDLPVGRVALDGSIEATIQQLFSDLGHTEFTDSLRKTLSNSWAPGVSFADAFASTLSRLLGHRGLVIINPLREKFKKLAAPIYVEAIRNSVEINSALMRRDEELSAAGYHAQVKIDGAYFPLFWHDDGGRRHPLKRTSRGTLVTKDRSREFRMDELSEIAADRPERLSPGVLLRPVVQDYLLPTLCYFAGSAEIAYSAQNSEVYRLLGRRPTTVFHRQSFTLIERKQAKIMDRYSLALKDLFDGPEALLMRLAEENIAATSARVFADAEEKINTELNRLDQHISASDPTVAQNLAKRRRKILYHIGAIREKFYRSQIRRDENMKRQIESIYTALLPKKQLQERTLNISYFLNRYGPELERWIYDVIELDDRGHRVVYL